MLSDFDRLVKERAALVSWWKLGSTHCNYGGGNYVLRVDVRNPSMVSFCGQQYAGDKNYYDAPAGFDTCISQTFAKHSKELAREAYEAEIARLNSEIAKHREMVLQQLAED